MRLARCHPGVVTTSAPAAGRFRSMREFDSRSAPKAAPNGNQVVIPHVPESHSVNLCSGSTMPTLQICPGLSETGVCDLLKPLCRITEIRSSGDPDRRVSIVRVAGQPVRQPAVGPCLHRRVGDHVVHVATGVRGDPGEPGLTERRRDHWVTPAVGMLGDAKRRLTVSDRCR